MLDLKLLQKQPEILAKALADRHSSIRVEEFLELDGIRRSVLAEVETLRQKQNAESKRIAELKRQKQEPSPEELQELSNLSSHIQDLGQQANKASQAVEEWLISVPNIPDPTTPVGKDENDNVEIARHGSPRNFDFPILAHWELGTKLGGLDFEKAVKLSGSRFALSLGWCARLERALATFFLNQHTENGALEVSPPYIVNRATMTGTGQLPKFAEDLFKLADWDYFLIPTAEVPLTNLYANDVIAEEDLPLCLCAATPCFRSEAGSAAKDTRGLIRLHQFLKVEMVRFAHPDDSANQLEKMTQAACNLLDLLELPYRVITLCTGDMGFSAKKTHDIEVWLPAQNTYREISSCSNCGDFQARRANIKFKPKAGGKASFVHTLNGSGLPIGRTIAAILENGQQKDGSVVLPKVLRHYLHGLEVIEPVK